MEQKKYDVIIVGAGPAGSSCAIALGNSGLRVAVVDKATFPRDKTCGDALSIDVVNQLSFMSEKLADNFKSLENKMPSYGIKVFSADYSSIAIPLIYKNEKRCGYVVPRMEFDNFLFQHAKQNANIDYYENTPVGKITVNENTVTVDAAGRQLQSAIIIGADGAHSVVAKQLANHTVDKQHYSGGLRIYYEGITGFEETNLIELHFFKEIIPGYLWLFPLANNRANVGIGMLSSAVAEKKINLKETLQHLINTKPHLKERFKNATALETVKGYGLPLGSKKRTLSGKRFLLAGDAASLIDPFTGEGIANAIRSGRIAAQHASSCFEKNNFSAAYNKNYDAEIYSKMWKEFKISTMLQNLTRHPRLCNLIIRKANSAKYIHKLLIEALANVDKRKQMLFNPKFYYKLLAGKRKKEGGAPS